MISVLSFMSLTNSAYTVIFLFRSEVDPPHSPPHPSTHIPSPFINTRLTDFHTIYLKHLESLVPHVTAYSMHCMNSVKNAKGRFPWRKTLLYKWRLTKQRNLFVYKDTPDQDRARPTFRFSIISFTPQRFSQYKEGRGWGGGGGVGKWWGVSLAFRKVPPFCLVEIFFKLFLGLIKTRKQRVSRQWERETKPCLYEHCERPLCIMRIKPALSSSKKRTYSKNVTVPTMEPLLKIHFRRRCYLDHFYTSLYKDSSQFCHKWQFAILFRKIIISLS